MQDGFSYQDPHLVVIEKVAGMPVQPDRSGDTSLLERVQALFPKAEVGSPHRLDRPVSGLVVFTLTAEALRGMNAAFREGRVEKQYLALVTGHMEPRSGVLQHRLLRDGAARKARVVEAPRGKVLRLHYTARQEGDRYTLLELTPEGGAFHQIRAQLGASGHAIKGDVKYGARRGEQDRSIALHAWRLRFKHPVTGEQIALEAPVSGLIRRFTELPPR